MDSVRPRLQRCDHHRPRGGYYLNPAAEENLAWRRDALDRPLSEALPAIGQAIAGLIEPVMRQGQPSNRDRAGGAVSAC